MGAAIFQPVIGYFLVKHWNGARDIHHAPIYTTHDFQIAFIVLVVVLAISFLLTMLLPRTRCRMIHPAYRAFKLKQLMKIRRQQLKERAQRKLS